eukprot:m.265794 g.265794  ORF g.265794 m.265794 type:complete len:73 (+) comp63841_c0_seq1:593-811(+)
MNLLKFVGLDISLHYIRVTTTQRLFNTNVSVLPECQNHDNMLTEIETLTKYEARGRWCYGILARNSTRPSNR